MTAQTPVREGYGVRSAARQSVAQRVGRIVTTLVTLEDHPATYGRA